jgi:hypothetical protein
MYAFLLNQSQCKEIFSLNFFPKTSRTMNKKQQPKKSFIMSSEAKNGAMQGMLTPSVVPVGIKQALDPRVKLTNERSYAILKGGREVTPQQFPATSTSDTNIVFDVNPPSSFIIVDKKVWIRCPFLVTITGPSVAPATLLQIGVNDGPRSYPLMQSILSTRATINNTTVSINTNNVMQALLWYHNNYSVRREDYSGTPAMLDQWQTYAEGVGAVRNPLGAYGDNTAEEARCAGQVASAALLNSGVGTFTVLSDNGATAQVLMVVQEPIFLSPFLFGPGEEAGFYGVNKMTLNLQMGDLSRVWSHSSAGNPLTSVTASITGAQAFGAGLPTAQFTYITPKQVPQLPSAIYYPYFEIVEYVTSGPSIAPGLSGTVTTNSIFFSTIPRRIYFFLRRSNATRNYSTADTFAFINSINVTYANRTGLLQSQNPQCTTCHKRTVLK